MIYRLLRWIAGVALDWFYAGIEVVGAERVPADVPLLVVANHPNQLVDALLVARALGRRVTFTGKAVLMENPAVALLGRTVGFVPLRRVQDELKARGGPPTGNLTPPGATSDTGSPPARPPDRDRNAAAFDAIISALGRREAVLIFPEGISHDRPELAPIKTGAARIALQARDRAGVRALHVVAVGLTFERKWDARTRVLVQVGEPLALDGWRPAPPAGADGAASSDDAASADDAAAATQLTAEVERRLRAVTLNFPTPEARGAVLPTSALLATLLEDDVRPLGDPEAPLPAVVELARRVEAVRCALAEGGDAGASASDHTRVGRFSDRLERLRATLAARRIAPSEVLLEPVLGAGAWFVLREAVLVALGGPVALWGRMNHWAPLALARAASRRTSRNPEDPAMHTIVAGLLIVPVFYAAQTALVWRLAGAWWALPYLLSLPVAAGWWLRYADRLAHARRRMRAWLLFRREPELREELRREAEWVRGEAAEIERAIGGREVVGSV
ncbi:MAG: 1-acyl-sn-glycerol-3-phosphate acyltransferase [Gemmatimonadaceae bacterium]